MEFCWQRDKSICVFFCSLFLLLLLFIFFHPNYILNVRMKNKYFHSPLIINSLGVVGGEWGYFTNTGSRLSQVILEGS